MDTRNIEPNPNKRLTFDPEETVKVQAEVEGTGRRAIKMCMTGRDLFLGIRTAGSQINHCQPRGWSGSSSDRMTKSVQNFGRNLK